MIFEIVYQYFLQHFCFDQLSNTGFSYSATRTGNNLYQELSFQDSDALGDIDEGADITGKFILVLKIDALNIEY